MVLPGPSSSIVCDANMLLVGERVSCTLYPRHGLGALLSACPEQFFFAPVDHDSLLVSVWNQDGNPFPTENLLEAINGPRCAQSPWCD